MNSKINSKIKMLLSRMAFEDEAWRFPGSVYDTFKALHTIALYDHRLLEGGPLGKISALLVSIERTPGGPYYSDFPDSSGRQVNRICDQKTNEAIRGFLSIYDVNLPNLNKFLDKKGTNKKTKDKKLHAPTHGSFDPGERAMMMKIRALLKVRLAPFPRAFRKLAGGAIEKTIRGNPDKQMSLMPYYMKLSLGKKADRILEKTVVSMGLFNIFFWTAFIIYDDFWDKDEAADPRLLPVANFFARDYVSFFDSLFVEENGFRKFFHQLMDNLDSANAWETETCRMKMTGDILEIPDSLPEYGDYVNKYRPASGHVLAPLALLVLSGCKIHSAEAKHLIAYFRHYLIAMQINDDMHDWEEDMRRGHISTVVNMLLLDLPAGKKTINLAKDTEELRKTFWFTTLPKMAKKARAHTKKSRAELLAMKSIRDPARLLYFIDFNQKIAEKAKSEQKQSIEFLNAYGK